MDIVRFKAGLGNQMFQYALLKALSSRGRIVLGSLGFYTKYPDLVSFSLNQVFKNVQFDVVDEHIFEKLDECWKVIKQNNEKLREFLLDYSNRFFWVEDPEGTYNEHIFDTCNCVFVGYWQTEKYFISIRKEILRDFKFSYGEEQLNKVKKQLLISNRYVSVHIRRGDYLKCSKIYGGICTKQYYESAILHIKKYIDNLILVFFSDDMEWVKKYYYFENAIYIEEKMFEHYQAWYDMCLMSCCSANIIANSTFSWWGAWLNQRPEKRIVAPNPWFNEYKMPDICPDEWIRINSKGELYNG